jgi:cytochrome c oxidase subunit 1
MFCTISAYVLGLGIVTYFTVVVWSYFKGKKVGNDPWDGRTLERSIPSPPPEHNFTAIPKVHARDAWWYEKTHADEIAKEKAATIAAESAHGGIHMPDQSWFPLVAAIGMLIGGLAFAAGNIPAAIGGLVLTFLGIYLWALEGPGGYHIHLDKDGNATEDHSH